MQKSSSRWASLFLFTAVIFGAIVRFAPTIITGQPINDGGMFYIMIRDLTSNHFLIPAFTSYNRLNIPFAYPPFSFYVGGLLSILGIPIIEVIRWVPPLVSTLSILAFYWMSGLILDSKSKATLATLAYALIPRSFSWYVMGGGLSRTFGVLFLLLTCAATWKLLTHREPKYIILTAVFGAGAVLSHPETGLHTAAACALIYLFKGRTVRGLRDILLVAFGVLVLACPWWLTVLSQHGFAPFQSAFHTGGHDALFWLPWFTFDFAEERFVTFFTVLGLIGIAVQLFRRDWFLTVWLLMTFVVEPRSATAIAALPLAMLAGISLSDFIIPGFAFLVSKAGEGVREWTAWAAQNRNIRIILAYLLLSGLLGSFSYDLSLARYIVPAKGRAAMAWVQNNTPADARFVVLTGAADPFSDPTAEWFPALAARTSQDTVQGREWLLGADFTPYVGGIGKLQRCLNDSPACVEDWAGINHLPFNYIYIEKSAASSIPGLLSYQLRQDVSYALVFENEAAVIFGKR